MQNKLSELKTIMNHFNQLKEQVNFNGHDFLDEQEVEDEILVEENQRSFKKNGTLIQDQKIDANEEESSKIEIIEAHKE